MSFDECPKSYVFRGKKDVNAAEIAQMLGLKPGAQPLPGQQLQMSQDMSGSSRFLMPVSECEFQLTSILEDLTKDCWPHSNVERPQRCTGTALAVSIGLLEATSKFLPGRVMLFVGGPPTVGPGMFMFSSSVAAVASCFST